MKCAVVLFCVIVMLTGCDAGDAALERGTEFRSELLSSDQCSFDAVITADYGDKCHVFAMNCSGSREGDLRFTVTAPESISGISGMVSETGGKLTFDDVALQFDSMAEGRISPVSAPWVFFQTLRGGYMTSAGMEADLLRLTIHDSYAEDALQLDIWLDSENTPVRGEILHKNRRIITMDVANFTLQ